MVSFAFFKILVFVTSLLVLATKIRRYQTFVYATNVTTNPINSDKASMAQTTLLRAPT